MPTASEADLIRRNQDLHQLAVAARAELSREAEANRLLQEEIKVLRRAQAATIDVFRAVLESVATRLAKQYDEAEIVSGDRPAASVVLVRLLSAMRQETWPTD